MCNHPECQKPENYTGQAREHFYVDPSTGETKKFVFWPYFDSKSEEWKWPQVRVTNGVVEMSPHHRFI